LSFDELYAILSDNWIWATARQDATPNTPHYPSFTYFYDGWRKLSAKTKNQLKLSAGGWGRFIYGWLV